MMRLTLALLAALLLATGLTAQTTLPETLVLRARIVQLESLLSACNTQRAIVAIEKDAGCPLDWSVNPVTCKAGK